MNITASTRVIRYCNWSSLDMAPGGSMQLKRRLAEGMLRSQILAAFSVERHDEDIIESVEQVRVLVCERSATVYLHEPDAEVVGEQKDNEEGPPDELEWIHQALPVNNAVQPTKNVSPFFPRSCDQSNAFATKPTHRGQIYK